MSDITESGPAQGAPTADQVDQFRDDLRAARVDAVVLPDARPEAPALLTSLTVGRSASRRTPGASTSGTCREVTDGAG